MYRNEFIIVDFSTKGDKHMEQLDEKKWIESKRHLAVFCFALTLKGNYIWLRYSVCLSLYISGVWLDCCIFVMVTGEHHKLNVKFRYLNSRDMYLYGP